ncbi:SDR family oxidoreductase [Paludibacter jiangxiensis]|uniref:NAD(P)H dehydrogenase n=1 Tax=Paludibacter jiangxiensis TaxID=681398 RepID=A0A170YQY7_9BACT|nr:SDR family oxidoreductase [Paludibacter jiangxiensis]GAT61990.1 NAD(P)H dehydrogenase [Paludibacter jiangxiensis]
MKIGITGATGQLGVLVVNKLKEKVAAENIVALVRSPQKAAALGVEAREADYNQPETLEKAFQGIDKLLVISGNEIGQRLSQHTNIINAAKKAGVKLIVYTSVLHADTSTLSLAEEHLGTEAALKASGVPYVLLRNGWYTENYTGSIGGVLAGGALLGSSGDGKISSATRADFAEAAVAVLTGEGQEGKVYELAGDEVYTMSDLAAEISKQTGKNIPYKNLPVAEYAAALISVGLPEGIAHFLAGTHVSTEKGDLFDDGHQLSKLIGHSTTSLTDAVKAALAGLA